MDKRGRQRARAQELLEKGKTLLEEGRVAEASRELNKAVRAYSRSDDKLGEAQAQVALGCAYQKLDEKSMARDCFIAAWHIASDLGQEDLLRSLIKPLGDLYEGVPRGLWNPSQAPTQRSALMARD